MNLGRLKKLTKRQLVTTVLIVDVASVTARPIDIPSHRVGKPLLVPEDDRGVIKARSYEALELADKHGRSCWIYVRA